MLLSDFREGVSFRIAQDLRTRDKILSIVDMRRAYRDLEASNADLRAIIANNGLAIQGLRETNAALLEGKQRSDRKARRRQPWAIFGKVVVGTGVVAGVAQLVKLGTN